jgi:DNA-binding transcriptional regulator YhcF (GntR family)
VRFWITKNSELSVRDQLVRQVILAILSEDLPAGQKIPSIRALARRHQIHSNTVSAAYHQLLEEGWLELRRGSGLYVSSRHAPSGARNRLDQLLADMLRDARLLGHGPDQVLHRLERMIRPAGVSRIVVIEPDSAMLEILLAEIRQQLNVPVETAEITKVAGLRASRECLIASLPAHQPMLRQHLANDGPLLFALRLRSVQGSLEGEVRPSANAILTIVSSSIQFRQSARTVL